MSASLVVAHVQKIKTLPHLHMEKFYFRTIACKSGKIDLPLSHTKWKSGKQVYHFTTDTAAVAVKNFFISTGIRLVGYK